MRRCSGGEGGAGGMGGGFGVTRTGWHGVAGVWGRYVSVGLGWGYGVAGAAAAAVLVVVGGWVYGGYAGEHQPG